MNNIVFKRDNIAHYIFVTLIFAIYPFLGLVIALFLFVFNRNVKLSLYVITAFFFCYGWTFIPAANFDFVRHQEIFVELQQYSTFKEFKSYMSLVLSPDVAVDYMYWFLGNISVNPQLIGAISAMFYYLLLFLIIKNFFANYLIPYNNPAKRALVISVFFALTVTWYFSGMRNGSALMLFIYLLVTLDISSKSLKNVVLILLPGFLHFSLFPISILLILSKYISTRSVVLFAVIGTLLFPFINKILILFGSFTSGMGLIGQFISAKLDSYVLHGTEASMYTGAGYRFYLVIIPLLVIIPFIWFTVNPVFRAKSNSSKLLVFHKFVLLLWGYSVLLIDTYALSRNLMVFGYVFSLYLFYLLWDKLYRSNGLKIFILLFMLHSAISILPSWYMGKEYLCINTKLIFSDLVTILNENVTSNDYW